MSTDLSRKFDDTGGDVRPFADLPTLRLVEPARDVRGWEIRERDGRLVGTVVDLLVDVDRLEARTLLVSLSGPPDPGGTTIVPVNRIAPEDASGRRLTLGHGMAPIALGYQSTTRMAVWATIGTAIVALIGWMTGLLG
jgi:hypothetical protein